MFLVLLLVCCFLAGLAASLLWLKMALARQWFDIPNQRSSHTRPTPKGGGLAIAIVFGIIILVLVGWNQVAPEEAWFLLPGMSLALAGFMDDLVELGVLPRIGVQVVAVTCALWMLPTVPELPIPLLGAVPSWFAMALLATAWVWFINLYNFMAGIDGLAASEAVFVALALAWFALDAGLYDDSMALLVLGSVIAGFLSINWSPARLFMGDAGSNFLGFMLAAFGVMLTLEGAITLWTLLILLLVFVTDASCTLLKRMAAGLVWYHGHRSHAYQLVAAARQSHGVVVGVVTGINLVWLLPLAWLSRDMGEWGALVALVACVPLLVLVNHCHGRYLAHGME